MTAENQIPDFVPCADFAEWLPQAAAVLGAVAAELHNTILSGNTDAATIRLTEMIPAFDGMAAEFRVLLGHPARPDLIDD